jgi:hypothetical protein
MSDEKDEKDEKDISDIIERRVTKPPLLKQMSIIQPDSLLSFLDNLDHKEISEKSLFLNNLNNLNNENNQLTCKYCKKELLTQYALERHIVKCFEKEITRINEENYLLKKKIEDLEKEYDDDIARILKYVEYTDKKWLKLCHDNYEEMKRIVLLDIEE